MLFGFDAKGKCLGGILLVAGSCIGSGMLGMPVMSAEGGFFPSVILFTLAWLFMLFSGFALLEANLWFEEGASLITLAGKTLGRFGQSACWLLFLFLFYSIMVALFSAGGQLVNEVGEHLFQLSLPSWAGSLSILFIFGLVLLVGTQAVDGTNRLFMIGLIVSYVILVVLGIGKIETKNLMHTNWKASYFAFPAMLIAFGFQNLIPSLTRYLHKDVRSLKKVIIYGSLLPLIVYLFWQAIVLGILPFAAFKEAVSNGEMATVLLKRMTGNNWVVTAAEYFAFFALMTTFIGVALSLVDFLSDGLSLQKNKKNQFLLVCLALLPPFFCSVINPHLFLRALKVAGGLGVMLLFGVLPALMVYQGRYRQERKGIILLKGGKLALACIFLASLVVIGLELADELGFLYGK